MKKTLKNLVLGATLVGSLMSTGCERQENKIDSSLPAISVNQTQWEPVSENQRIKYTYAKNSSSYDLLTDLDSDGSWDVLERKACGYNGQAEYGCQHAFYIKKGFSIPESIAREPIRISAESTISPKTEISFVESEFFESYQ